MASTYSTLEIQLMATGENSTTWGTVTNVNLGTAIEEAIVGSANVTFASADVTLTLSHDNSSQTARNMRLRCTGTTGGSTRNLIIPVVAGSNSDPFEKPYIIQNDCADSIVVKTAAGTGVTVPAGKTMWVYANGTNVVDVTTHLTSLTLGTALAIAQGGTGANTASGARTALGATAVGDAVFIAANAADARTAMVAAASGANSDITSLSGLTTALSIAQGGTGGNTAANARTALSAAASGANSDITSLSGLTTALSIGQGGTGANTAADARTALGAQATLVSGTNIKTVNGTSLLGSGDVSTSLPTGIITLWSGSAASIPTGWLLCDGTNGTPDLRDRFVVGAGSTYAVGATGGSANATLVSHTHTATVTDPGHVHNLPGSTSAQSIIQTQLGVNSTSQNGQTATATTGITVGISTEGSSATNANLPPYYALCYIMKS